MGLNDIIGFTLRTESVVSMVVVNVNEGGREDKKFEIEAVQLSTTVSLSLIYTVSSLEYSHSLILPPIHLLVLGLGLGLGLGEAHYGLNFTWATLIENFFSQPPILRAPYFFDFEIQSDWFIIYGSF